MTHLGTPTTNLTKEVVIMASEEARRRAEAEGRIAAAEGRSLPETYTESVLGPLTLGLLSTRNDELRDELKLGYAREKNGQ